MKLKMKVTMSFFYHRIQSDSATYGGGSLGEGVGPYLFVQHKYPNPFSSGSNYATLWRLIGDWVEGYANLHMPYGGQQAVMFNYGDASFVSKIRIYPIALSECLIVSRNWLLLKFLRSRSHFDEGLQFTPSYATEESVEHALVTSNNRRGESRL